MANKHSTLTELFTGIADEIRAKKNTTEPIIADNFPMEIENLRTGFAYGNNDVTTIPDYAFYGCEDLKSVDCYNLTSIGVSAFENCSNLKSVILYDSVTNVGENAFKGCSNLTIYCMFDSIPDTWSGNWNPDNREVVFMSPVETWDISATSSDNVTAKLYEDDGTYLLHISGNGDMINFNSFANDLPWVNHCDRINNCVVYDSVTSIGNWAFYGCTSLTSITIPDSVTSIGNYAFYGCTSLTSITIPDSVTSIGNSAFDSCTSLTSITIPDSVTSIGNSAFRYCTSLTSITIPDSVTSINDYAFDSCTSLTSITIPDSVTSIGSMCKKCGNLKSVTIPDSVTSITGYAFYGCTSLTSIIYAGAVSQWDAIRFGSYWNDGTPDYTIHCTDGDIAKDGTVTYHNT